MRGVALQREVLNQLTSTSMCYQFCEVTVTLPRLVTAGPGRRKENRMCTYSQAHMHMLGKEVEPISLLTPSHG